MKPRINFDMMASVVGCTILIHCKQESWRISQSRESVLSQSSLSISSTIRRGSFPSCIIFTCLRPLQILRASSSSELSALLGESDTIRTPIIFLTRARMAWAAEYFLCSILSVSYFDNTGSVMIVLFLFPNLRTTSGMFLRTCHCFMNLIWEGMQKFGSLRRIENNDVGMSEYVGNKWCHA